ncbi:MAG: aminotransferase class I/II-fold pyridoxal phosphate-dependent enzyme [Gemmatimonadetes bacterium]|nr:aminotransferase class I/II-fold pyridoxal phosphate-dependent enzyme [Gemmatimonadota bacterium]
MSVPEGLVRSAILAMPAYRGLPAGRRPEVRLDGNENPLGASAGVLAALKAHDPATLARYPASQALKERWARALGVKPDELLITNGSGPALALAGELVLGAGDTCVIAAPSFELYAWVAERREARVVAVACDAANQFAFPVEGFRQAIEDAGVPPKLVVIGLPDNPTGTAPPTEFITTMAKAHRRTLFLVDEAYVEFYGVTVVPQAVRLPNLLVSRTFSKALGLAGERIGGLVGHAELIDLARRINVPYPVTGMAVALGLAALDDSKHIVETVRVSRASVRRLAAEVKAAGFPTIATRANYALVNTGSSARAGALTALLGRRGVAIRNRSHLQAMGGWVRISAGNERDTERCLDEIRLLTAPSPEAILFDMDGVLVDVSQSYDEAIVRTTASFLPAGKLVSRESVLAVKERPNANDDVDAACLALAKLGFKPPRKEVERRFQELYLGTRRDRGLHAKEKWLLPAAQLRRLAQRFKLGIVTGRPRDEARMALKRSGTGRYFKVVITADDVRKKKPNPDPIRAALKKLRVQTAWMVGDSPADLLAAQCAGIAAIGVRASAPDAARRETTLRAHRPLAVLDMASDLLNVLDERDRYEKESRG